METSEKGEDFVPIEKSIKMNHLEQYVFHVLRVTSRYNTSTSYYYAPINLVGKYVKYPSYGDFPETYFLRSYGKWWKQSEAYQLEYRPQDTDPLGAEDYIILEFESAVVPRDICIYEVYNPGAVVRIWGNRISERKLMMSSWCLLWEGPPQTCPHESRKFHPPIKKINTPMNTIRLEFNQSHLQYHYSIDAVLLAGYQPVSPLQWNVLCCGILDGFTKKAVTQEPETKDTCDLTNSNEDLFVCLPYEVILHIFQYLDLKSLSRCAQVNKIWNEAAADPVLYHNLSLKPYWNVMDYTTSEYFMNRCKTLKRLDVSWCEAKDTFDFSAWLSNLMHKSRNTLTHLSICNCQSMEDGIIVAQLSRCTELIDLRLKNVDPWPKYFSIDGLTKLVSLDLSSTTINDSELMHILRANPNLKHIILDQCENLISLNRVVETLESHNRKLRTWSSWKTVSLSVDGIRRFANFPELRELDLGWCLMNRDPGDCIDYIANGCRHLQRLILSEWRGLNDHLVMSVVLLCKELTQLDLLGIKNISADFCEKALATLPKLKLLEISFCEMIRQEEVEVWRQKYPHVTIQRSCQYVVNDYLN